MRSNPTPTTAQVARANITSAEQCARLHHAATALGIDDVLTVLDLLSYLLGEQDRLPSALTDRSAA